MRWNSHSILFVAFIIEIGVLVLYTILDHSYTTWNLLTYLGFGEKYSKKGINTTDYGITIKNDSVLVKINLPERKTDTSRRIDAKYLHNRIIRPNNSFDESFTKESVRTDVKAVVNDAEDTFVVERILGTRHNTTIARANPISSNIFKNVGYVKGTRNLEYHYLVCPDPYGRLGNILFQYAASVGIAKALKYNHIIKSSHKLLKYFEIKNIMEEELDHMLTMTEDDLFNQEWLENKTYLSHNLTIFGYFQAWTYFQNISDQIRLSLTIKPYYLEKARWFLKINVPGLKDRIGIHVRRGDFQTSYAVEEGRVVADKSYISKAMDYFKENYVDVFFIVLSDDIRWCKENIIGSDIIFSEFEEPIIDMAIMSLCDHMIITAGSFGWWGGWLSGGTVIYLKDFPRSGSPLDRKAIRKETYYLPDWIGMSNG